MRNAIKAMVVFLALALASYYSTAQDVYNFYFQKGPAPQSVIQGGAGQQAAQTAAPPVPATTPPPPAVTAPPPPAPAEVAKAPEQPKKEYLDYKPVDILLGVARHSDDVGSGGAYAFGLQYNFNRYIGVRGIAQYLATETAQYEQSMNHDATESAANKWGGSLAFVFTPIHIDLLGHQLLKVSALGGLMTDRKFDGSTPVGAEHDIRTIVHPFYGFGASYSLNDNVALDASVAMQEGGKVGNAMGSLVFSF